MKNTICHGIGLDGKCGVHEGFEVRKLKRNDHTSDIVCPHPSCPHQVDHTKGSVQAIIIGSNGNQRVMIQPIL